MFTFGVIKKGNVTAAFGTLKNLRFIYVVTEL